MIKHSGTNQMRDLAGGRRKQRRQGEAPQGVDSGPLQVPGEADPREIRGRPRGIRNPQGLRCAAQPGAGQHGGIPAGLRRALQADRDEPEPGIGRVSWYSSGPHLPAGRSGKHRQSVYNAIIGGSGSGSVSLSVDLRFQV